MEFQYDLKEFTYEFGYGKLSAGMLDLKKGKKSFGTLGQSSEYDFDSSPTGVIDNWNQQIGEYQIRVAVTFLPVVDHTDTSVKNIGKVDISS